MQVYAAVRLVVSSNGSADVTSILTDADTSLAAKLVVSDPVKAGKSFTARLTGGRRKTGTSTPDASFTPRPSISRRCDMHASRKAVSRSTTHATLVSLSE